MLDKILMSCLTFIISGAHSFVKEIMTEIDTWKVEIRKKDIHGNY